MGSIRAEALHGDLAFGCRITGVTEAALRDEDARAQIRALFETHGLILFEGVEPSNRLQVAISLVFGSMKEHPVDAVDLIDPENMPGAIEITSNPETSDIVEIGGKAYSSWLPWHFDHCYNNELNRAGVLRVVRITPNGGETCFLDGIELYATFPPELRARIEGQSVVYSMAMHLDLIRFGRPEGFRVLQADPAQFQILEQAKVSPRAIHPAVWTRAGGEKVLHVSPWMAEGIEGWEDGEAHALLDAVTDAIHRAGETRAYRHRWRPTDMLIWDNWRMLHRVTGCTPPHPRSIYRTTIRGDYGLGRFENGVEGRFAALERTV